MYIQITRQVVKQQKKLNKVQYQAFLDRIDLFLRDQFHPSLHGEYEGCRSINITGDIRAIYYMNDALVIFVRIGTHSELYE